jgi:hypothetical protein
MPAKKPSPIKKELLKPCGRKLISRDQPDSQAKKVEPGNQNSQQYRTTFREKLLVISAS